MGCAKVDEKEGIKEAISKEDYESMKKLLEEFNKNYAIGSSVYQQPGNQPPVLAPDQNDSR